MLRTAKTFIRHVNIIRQLERPKSNVLKDVRASLIYLKCEFDDINGKLTNILYHYNDSDKAHDPQEYVGLIRALSSLDKRQSKAVGTIAECIKMMVAIPYNADDILESLKDENNGRALFIQNLKEEGHECIHEIKDTYPMEFHWCKSHPCSKSERMQILYDIDRLFNCEVSDGIDSRHRDLWIRKRDYYVKCLQDRSHSCVKITDNGSIDWCGRTLCKNT